MTDLNPQAKQMADESMVRNLAAQALAIWPQEVELIRRYQLGDDLDVLDAGCGTGEISSRLAQLFPRSRVLGIDILEQHLALARSRCAHLTPRLTFEARSIFELGLPDRAFDLTVCRHVLQSIPQVERALVELLRVTRLGGRLHLIAEDYGMLQFQKGPLDPADFWAEAPRKFGSATGTDLFIGRNIFGILAGLGARDIAINYVVVDTLRVPRETFAAIIEAWRDGYAEDTAAATRFSGAEVVAYFNQMIASIRAPMGYAVWFVPVVSALVSSDFRLSARNAASISW